MAQQGDGQLEGMRETGHLNGMVAQLVWQAVAAERKRKGKASSTVVDGPTPNGSGPKIPA